MVWVGWVMWQLVMKPHGAQSSAGPLWLELVQGLFPEMAGREFWGFLELGISLLLGEPGAQDVF